MGQIHAMMAKACGGQAHAYNTIIKSLIIILFLLLTTNHLFSNFRQSAEARLEPRTSQQLDNTHYH